MNSKEEINTLIYPGCGVCLSLNQVNKGVINTIAYDCDDVSQCAGYVILLSGHKLRSTDTHLPETDDR
jgi:hypothetical protein